MGVAKMYLLLKSGNNFQGAAFIKLRDWFVISGYVQRRRYKMAIDPIWFAIEQTSRVVKSLGWEVTKTDTTGDTVLITISKKKEDILKP